jgi:hypothetical protein
MTFPTILGRPQPSARRRPEDRATAGGTSRSVHRYHRLVRMSADRPELMTDWVAAQICRVSLEVIGLWVETGAWPLPEAICATTLYFRALDVECWLDSGRWPTSVQFRDVPYQVDDEAPPQFLTIDIQTCK